MNNYIMTFANININLMFETSGLDMPLNKKLMDEIINYYAALLKKKTKKHNSIIHFQIIFSEGNSIKQIKLKKQNYYSEFYIKTNAYTYVTYYHISLIQFQLLLRIILHNNTKDSDIFMLHSSGNLQYGKSLLFLGKSGSGKSTIMKMLSLKYQPIADDSIIISNTGKNFFTYQTPFIEKNTNILRKNNSIPLGGIYFLKKSTRYAILPIYDKDLILNKLLQNCIIKDKNSISKNIKKIYKLTQEFNNFFIIEFGLDRCKLNELFKTNVFKI